MNRRTGSPRVFSLASLSLPLLPLVVGLTVGAASAVAGELGPDELPQDRMARHLTRGGSDSPSLEDDHYFLNLSGGYLRSLNKKYNGMAEGALGVGIALSKRDVASVIVGGGALDLKGGTRAADEAHSPTLLKLGFAWNHTFTHHRAFLQPYTTVGVNGVWVNWDYRADKVSGGDTVEGDDMAGVEIYGGAGLALRPAQHVRIYGEFIAGTMGFTETTSSELRNNLFEAFTYVGIRVGLKFAW